MVAATGSGEPHLTLTESKHVVMSWLEPSGDGTALRFAVLQRDTWSDVGTVASGEDWFVNWADFPSVVPIDGDRWAAHWLAKRPGGTYAYDVAMSLSNDGGETWSLPMTPHRDDTATEHGFVTLFPWLGEVGALWLDGRNMEAGEHGHGQGGMTLRAATISDDLEPQREVEVDGLVCDCCQTDVAMSSTGPVAVYRNRTEDEVRDIYITRWVDGRWQPGVPVADDGWVIAGCPVNGPAIDASGDHVAVAWFTAADGDSRVRLALSSDGGATFGATIDVAIERPVGRVDLVAFEHGAALVSYLQLGAGGKGEIRVRRVPVEGQPGESLLVAATDAGRMSGFPQMISTDNEVVFAWTDVGGSGTQVKSAMIGLKDLVGD